MQRHLSQAVKRLEESKAVAGLNADQSLGAGRRRQRFQEERHPYAGDAYAAMPWQEEGQLHLPNDVVQLMLWQRYRLRVPRKNRLPPQDCRCAHKGMPRVGGECGAEEYAVGTEAELAWLEHPAVCHKQAKIWTAVHDHLVRVWVALLKNAGAKLLRPKLVAAVQLWRRDWEARTDHDHRAILDALRKGQTDLACATLARHVGWIGKRKTAVKNADLRETYEIPG